MFLSEILRPDPTLYFNAVPRDIVTTVKRWFPFWTVGRTCYAQESVRLSRILRHIGVFSDNVYVLGYSNTIEWDDVITEYHSPYMYDCYSMVIDDDDNVWIQGHDRQIIQYARNGDVKWFCQKAGPFVGLYDTIEFWPITRVGVFLPRLSRKQALALAPTNARDGTEIEIHISDVRKIAPDYSIQLKLTMLQYLSPCSMVLDAADNVIVRYIDAVRVFNLNLQLIATFDIKDITGLRVAIDKNGALLLCADTGYTILHTY